MLPLAKVIPKIKKLVNPILENVNNEESLVLSSMVMSSHFSPFSCPYDFIFANNGI